MGPRLSVDQPDVVGEQGIVAPGQLEVVGVVAAGVGVGHKVWHIGSPMRAASNAEFHPAAGRVGWSMQAGERASTVDIKSRNASWLVIAGGVPTTTGVRPRWLPGG